MSSFRICQVSDIHITLKKGKALDGIDVKANFDKALKDIKAVSPDLLVLSGDLCFTRNDRKIYPYVRDRLEATGLEYIVMAGNHDKSSSLAKAFGYGLTGRNLLFIRDTDEYRLIFADSSRHRVGADQLEYIGKALETEKKPVLFIHHPPSLAGVPFMDRKYPLLDREELQTVVARYKGKVPVFCGHYHNARQFNRANMEIFLAPSTYFQISDKTTHFTVSSEKAGWRYIELSDTIETELRFI